MPEEAPVMKTSGLRPLVSAETNLPCKLCRSQGFEVGLTPDYFFFGRSARALTMSSSSTFSSASWLPAIETEV